MTRAFLDGGGSHDGVNLCASFGIPRSSPMFLRLLPSLSPITPRPKGDWLAPPTGASSRPPRQHPASLVPMSRVGEIANLRARKPHAVDGQDGRGVCSPRWLTRSPSRSSARKDDRGVCGDDGPDHKRRWGRCATLWGWPCATTGTWAQRRGWAASPRRHRLALGLNPWLRIS
jgi:hypothetical protein